MASYILAIDQGTTGTTVLLVDEHLNVQGKETVDFPQYYPKPGWVEHDLNEIWNSALKAIELVFEKTGISPKSIQAIGITNQRETTCFWEKNESGSALGKAIVWQDRRTTDFCAHLKKQGLEKGIRKKTGLLLDPYFSGTKISWRLKNDSSLRTRAKTGKVCFGTIDSFLLYRMSGEHRTDASNASRTLLMDLKSCKWDEDLIKIFKVPQEILPEICDTSVVYGKTKKFSILPDGIPISGIAGDQQAALFGQACFERGTGKCTYGTGAFALINTGTEPVFSKHGMLTTVGWRLQGKTTFGLEGSAFIAGAAVQWLKEGLKLFSKSSEVEALARSVPDSGGVVFVPALSGMGAPHWLPTATGLLTGLTRGSTPAHIARATLEGIGFQVNELLQSMIQDSKRKLKPLKVDGGAAENDFLMQFQADISQIPIVRSQIIETTALGAALQAGLGIGFWSGLEEINQKWKSQKTFKPELSASLRKSKILGWEKAIKALKTLS